MECVHHQYRESKITSNNNNATTTTTIVVAGEKIPCNVRFFQSFWIEANFG